MEELVEEERMTRAVKRDGGATQYYAGARVPSYLVRDPRLGHETSVDAEKVEVAGHLGVEEDLDPL